MKQIALTAARPIRQRRFVPLSTWQSAIIHAGNDVALRRLIWCQSTDDVVNYDLSESIAQREVRLQKAMIRGAKEKIEGDVDISRRGYLATLDGPFDDGPMLCSHGYDESVSPYFGQLWVSLDLGNEPDQCSTRDCTLHRANPAP